MAAARLPVGVQRVNGHALAVTRIPPNASLDAALRIPWAAQDDGLVHTPHLDIQDVLIVRTVEQSANMHIEGGMCR